MFTALLALLLVVLGLLFWRAATRRGGVYRRFKALTSTRARLRVYRRWLLESVLVMGGLGAAVLLGAWPFVPGVLRGTQGWGPISAVRGFLGTGVGIVVSVVVVVVVVAALIAPALLLRGASDDGTGREGIDAIPAVGDIRALLPRVRAELGYGVGLGVQAGVFEELLFRLALPALLFGLLPDAGWSGPLAFGIAALVFGMLHLYQGLPGILLATLLGLVFAAVYVVTGSIVVTMALHAAIDLRTLVLIPIALGGAWKAGR